MNIKALLSSVVIGTASIFGGVSAQAYQVDFDCGTIGGYDACISYQDRNNPDQILVQGPRGEEYIEVSCYTGGGYDWESYGANSKQFNDYIVQSFCR